MLPKVMLHKRNGHRHPAPTKNPSLGDMLRLVHSVREPAPKPTYDLLKYASVVRTEKAAALLEQAAREIDAIQLGLSEVLAKTEQLFTHGELPDVRHTLEAFRSQAELSSQVMTKLMSAAGARAAERRLVSANEVLAQVVEELPLGPGSQVSVTSHRDPEVPWVVGNARQIRQVFATLLGHAVGAAAGGAPGAVVVETARERGALSGEDVVRVRISADGAELGPDVLAAVQRGTAGPTAVPAGPDLDLYIAAQIVAEHGGILSAENLPDHRARFTVELPAL